MWILSLAKWAFRFVTGPIKKAAGMWKMGKNVPTTFGMAHGNWVAKVTGDAFLNPRTRLIYQTMLWRQLPPQAAWIQPFARLDLGYMRAQGVGVKGLLSGKQKVTYVQSLKTTFNPKTKNLLMDYSLEQKNFYKWYAHELGINAIIDKQVDVLTFKKQRKHMSKVLRTLSEQSGRPNRHRRYHQRTRGASGDGSRENLAKLKLSKAKFLELKSDYNLDTPTEVMRSLDLLNDNDTHIDTTRTSFPKAPDSWLESALFSKGSGRAVMSPNKGKVFAVPSSIAMFEMMAKSTEPGKVLWRTAWIFKKGHTNVKRRNK